MALIPPQHLRLPVRRVPPDRLRRAQMQLDVLHRTAPARHPHGTRTTHLLMWGARSIAARRPAIDLTDTLRLNSSNF